MHGQVGGFFGVEVPPAESLAVILSLLGGGVGLSYLNRRDPITHCRIDITLWFHGNDCNDFMVMNSVQCDFMVRISW